MQRIKWGFLVCFGHRNGISPRVVNYIPKFLKLNLLCFLSLELIQCYRKTQVNCKKSQNLFLLISRFFEHIFQLFCQFCSIINQLLQILFYFLDSLFRFLTLTKSVMQVRKSIYVSEHVCSYLQYQLIFNSSLLLKFPQTTSSEKITITSNFIIEYLQFVFTKQKMPILNQIYLIAIFFYNMLRKVFGSLSLINKQFRIGLVKYKTLPLSQIQSHNFTKKLTYNFSNNSQKIRDILKSIKVDSNGKETDLLDSGMISHQHLDPETKKLTILLNISKDYMKIKNTLKQSFKNAGFDNVEINMTPKQEKQKEKGTRKGNLSNIKKIIAVSSCKGGVGKSTIAVNIAANLKNLGFKVGIFDSDIYGPSLPTLINRQGQTLQPSQSNPKQILPKYYQGITCMSFGFVGSKPATMRGPMVSSIVSQLLNQTQWGQLDYLVVDMPPGTGDIQISLCQEIKFDGAVIVTTPQRLAFMDVIKGIEMFQDLRVGILGVVENMAYYQCGKCGHRDQVFGKGYTKMIMQQFGIQNAFKIPLMGDITKYSDLGTPVTFVLPQSHKVRATYNQICESINKQLQKPRTTANAYYNAAERVIIVEQQNKKKKIDPYTLRLKCKCAGCIDQLSGALLIKKQNIKDDVHPLRMEEKGNYAVAVVWSDGHRSSIYPYKRLLSDDIPEK